MKRGFSILIAALLSGLAGFAISRWQSGGTSADLAYSGLPELEWLSREFHLSDEQYAQAAVLHLAYRPTCEMLCEKMMTSRDQIQQLVSAGTLVTPELEAALREQAALRVECQTAMLTHLYRTAACLSPRQAQNYLDAMLPEVMDMTMDPETTPGRH